MLCICLLFLHFIVLNHEIMLYTGVFLGAVVVSEILAIKLSQVVNTVAILSHNCTLQACNGTLALALNHKLALARLVLHLTSTRIEGDNEIISSVKARL